MGVAARGEPAGLDELAFLRIVELAVDKPSHAAAAIAAGDQHFAVGQQGCGVVLAGGIDLSGKAESAGASGRRRRRQASAAITTITASTVNPSINSVDNGSDGALCRRCRPPYAVRRPNYAHPSGLSRRRAAEARKLWMRRVIKLLAPRKPDVERQVDRLPQRMTAQAGCCRSSMRSPSIRHLRLQDSRARYIACDATPLASLQTPSSRAG